MGKRLWVFPNNFPVAHEFPDLANELSDFWILPTKFRTLPTNFRILPTNFIEAENNVDREGLGFRGLPMVSIIVQDPIS